MSDARAPLGPPSTSTTAPAHGALKGSDTEEERPSLAVLLRALFWGFVAGGVLRVVDLLLAAARPRVALAYARTWRGALRSSPYRTRSYAKVAAVKRSGRAPSELTYGETPLVTGLRILRRVGARRGDVVLDPLCGRGRFLLAARLLGCDARGLEIVEENVHFAAPHLRAAGGRLDLGDATGADYADADVVYLCWTCLEAKTRAAIEKRLSTLRPGARVVVGTWPVDAPGFREVWRDVYVFTWGRAEIFCFERTGA